GWDGAGGDPALRPRAFSEAQRAGSLRAHAPRRHERRRAPHSAGSTTLAPHLPHASGGERPGPARRLAPARALHQTSPMPVAAQRPRLHPPLGASTGGAGGHPLGRRRARRRAAAYLGLGILLLLLVEGASGWLLWVANHRRAAPAAAFLRALPADRLQGPWAHWLLDLPNLAAGHVWLGYLLLALTALKLWAVWWLLRARFPRRFGRWRLRLEKLAAWSLPMVYAVVLLSGAALDQRLGLGAGRAAVLDLHLWSSVLALPPTAWHLARFLATAWRVVGRDLGRGRA